MASDPLGINDLFLDGDLDAPTVHDMPDVWFWCRKHVRAEHMRARSVGTGCIRIGPFMSEREADRLSDDGTGVMGYTHDNPLGMEVEK